jgi:hypothetical protein
MPMIVPHHAKKLPYFAYDCSVVSIIVLANTALCSRTCTIDVSLSSLVAVGLPIVSTISALAAVDLPIVGTISASVVPSAPAGSPLQDGWGHGEGGRGGGRAKEFGAQCEAQSQCVTILRNTASGLCSECVVRVMKPQGFRSPSS